MKDTAERFIAVKDQKGLAGEITFSSPSDGTVSIQIIDESSRTRFISIKMTHEDLARGLMGLAMRPCTMEVQHLERIGKKKITEEFVFEMPKDNSYADRVAMAKDLAELHCVKTKNRTGISWTPSVSFNSQNSFFHKDGKTYARTTLSRWE